MAVYSDTRVLSLVQKQHGQRGVRELQGNSLRKALHTLQQHLVSVGLMDSLGVTTAIDVNSHCM